MYALKSIRTHLPRFALRRHPSGSHSHITTSHISIIFFFWLEGTRFAPSVTAPPPPPHVLASTCFCERAGSASLPYSKARLALSASRRRRWAGPGGRGGRGLSPLLSLLFVCLSPAGSAAAGHRGSPPWRVSSASPACPRSVSGRGYAAALSSYVFPVCGFQRFRCMSCLRLHVHGTR